jgi:hypothetical protein
MRKKRQSDADAERTQRPPEGKHEPSEDPDRSPFDYDEDDSMDWWENQYGPHGFKD